MSERKLSKQDIRALRHEYLHSEILLDKYFINLSVIAITVLSILAVSGVELSNTLKISLLLYISTAVTVLITFYMNTLLLKDIACEGEGRLIYVVAAILDGCRVLFFSLASGIALIGSF
jgi:bacteriorhodopsin